MPVKKRVQDTHISSQIRSLHGALLSIVGAMNRPQLDDKLIREAGISLERALFPLLVVIERLGPIGVVELAERAGRDYTTVSRQVAKLEELGLVKRQSGAHDKRVREAIATPKGRAMTGALDAARDRLGRAIFTQWEPQDIEALVHLLQKFAGELEAHAGNS